MWRERLHRLRTVWAVPPAVLSIFSTLYWIVDAASNIDFVFTRLKPLNVPPWLWKFLESGGNLAVFVTGIGWLGYLILRRPEREKVPVQSSVLQFIHKENERPFKQTKHDNPNISIVQIGLKNTSQKIVHNCYVRIERVDTENPSSLFQLFDRPKLAVQPPQRQMISIGAGDIEYIPIAQLDKINCGLAGLGIELLCHSVEGHTKLDPGQKHTLTIKASSETGQPIEEKYVLWADYAENLQFQKVG